VSSNQDLSPLTTSLSSRIYILSRNALSTTSIPNICFISNYNSSHIQENHFNPRTEVKMASQSASSSTPPEDTAFFCCNDIFNDISYHSFALDSYPGIVMMAMPRSSSQPPPKINISPTHTHNLLSESPRIMQVQGPINCINSNSQPGEGPLAMDVQDVLRTAVTSPQTLFKTQYFAGTAADGGSEITTWAKLEISDDRFSSEPGLNKIPSETVKIYRFGCSKHKKSFMVNVWMR
jgi:hypothetical protein